MPYREDPQLYGHQETSGLPERLQLLRDRYYLTAGPLVLLLAIGLGNAPGLAWTSGLLLVLLTVNMLVPRLR